MPKVINIMDKPVGAKDTRIFKYVGRPSEYGNPFIIGRDGTREEVVAKHIQYLDEHPELKEKIKKDLMGWDLGCFCAPEACHADILLRIANGDL